MSEALPIILDVDTGTDDALALAYAARNPRIDLVAVTTVAGNVGVDKATRNTLAVLEWLGAGEVPVHQGGSRPLVRPHHDAAHVHHENGLGGAELKAARRSVDGVRGPAAIIRLAGERPKELTLICVGPLTNLAIAMNVEPRLPEQLKAVVLMGGAYAVPGNTTPAAEFNIYVDPEAAAQVFAAPFASLTAVGLDVTEQVCLDRTDWDLASVGSSLPAAAALLREVGAFAFAEQKRDGFALHDPLAVAVAADPGLVDVEPETVVVELSESERGRTRVTGPGTVRVATVVDAQRALADFRETVGLTATSS